MDPVGETPPDNPAVSFNTTLFTVPPGLAVVVSVGEAVVTLTDSWPQVLATLLFLASPL